MALMRSNSSRRGWKSFQMARKGPLTFLARCGLLSLPPFLSNSDQCANTFLIKGITFFWWVSIFSLFTSVFPSSDVQDALSHVRSSDQENWPKAEKIEGGGGILSSCEEEIDKFFFCFYLRTLFFFSIFVKKVFFFSLNF